MAKVTAQIRADNQALLDGIMQGGSNKEAATGVLENALVHQAYEQGIFRRVLPVETERPEDAAPQTDSMDPTYIREVMPGSVGAFEMPFDGAPTNISMGLSRYRVVAKRIGAQRTTGDVMQLRGYQADVKKFFTDMQLRQLLFIEDDIGIKKVDQICGTSADAGTQDAMTRKAATGARGFIELGGPMSRQTLELFSTGLVSTDGALDIATALTNVVTIRQLIGMDHDQIGGPMAEQLLVKGIGKLNILGLDWVTTIKKSLVQNNIVYGFAEPEALGNFIMVEDITMFVKTEGHNIESWCSECCGISIAGMGAVCKASFSGATAGSWN
jgi:hypothetical protein